MKKIFLLLAFTGIVGATSANSLVTLAKGTLIAFNGDDKKQERKKKGDKKSCCSSKEAKGTRACSAEAGKQTKACAYSGTKTCTKGKEATANRTTTAVGASPSGSENIK